MFRTLSPGDSISIALGKLLLQASRRQVRLYSHLQQREQAVWASEIKYQVKEFSILCMGRRKPLAHWIHSFHMYLSYLGPSLFSCFPCFLHSLNSSLESPWWGEEVVVAIHSLDQFWEPLFTFGRQKSILYLLLINMAGDMSFTETRTKTLDHALFTPSVSWPALVLPMWPCEMWHTLSLRNCKW